MILELNDVLTENESHTLSFMANSGELMCITGGTAASRTRDGEPLTERTAQSFRELMAYAPERLTTLGEVTKYEPPTVQDVFSLKANRDIPISNGILGEEMRRTGADVSDERVQLLAVAVLLDKKILLVDNPPKETSGYLKNLAKQGKVVVVTSDEDEIISAADQVVEI